MDAPLFTNNTKIIISLSIPHPQAYLMILKEKKNIFLLVLTTKFCGILISTAIPKV